MLALVPLAIVVYGDIISMGAETFAPLIAYTRAAMYIPPEANDAVNTAESLPAAGAVLVITNISARELTQAGVPWTVQPTGAATDAHPPPAFELNVSTNAMSCVPAAAVVTQVRFSGDVLLLAWQPQFPAAAVLSARTRCGFTPYRCVEGKSDPPCPPPPHAASKKHNRTSVEREKTMHVARKP